MIVVTANRVSGIRVVRTLGLVRGNTIRTRHIGKDIMAVFRNIVGGEVAEPAVMNRLDMDPGDRLDQPVRLVPQHL